MKVAIVGGGPSGLAAAKACIEVIKMHPSLHRIALYCVFALSLQNNPQRIRNSRGIIIIRTKYLQVLFCHPTMCDVCHICLSIAK